MSYCFLTAMMIHLSTEDRVQAVGIISNGGVQKSSTFISCYFSASPVDDDKAFQRRFRISRPRFEKIFAKYECNQFFQQWEDCTCGI
eukprot:IDg10146t1